MATPPEKLLADLARAFPQPPLDAPGLALYLRELADVDPDALEAAVRMLIRTQTSPFRPTVAAIRETVAENTLQLPSEAAALSQIESRLAWGRAPVGDPPYVHPLVADSLRHVGGYRTFKESDSPSVLRGQLLKLYRDERTLAIRDAKLGSFAALEAGTGRPALPAGRRQPYPVVT